MPISTPIALLWDVPPETDSFSPSSLYSSANLRLIPLLFGLFDAQDTDSQADALMKYPHQEFTRRQCLAAVATSLVTAANLTSDTWNDSLWGMKPYSSSEGTSNDQTNSKGRPGLHIENGRFAMAGKPTRALGVNYFDCFSKLLTGDQSKYREAMERCETGFEKLQSLHIPFVRFNAGGFYPTNWSLYERSRDEYWKRWSSFVGLAEKYQIGLIPSLFWTFFTQPGLAKEPLSAWGDPASRTHERMRIYCQEMVERTNGSAALWAWEFGNEYNLEVDLPNGLELLKHWFHPSLGMPDTPTAADVLKTGHVHIALNAFADEIRKIDKHRAILAGHASPRSSAWNLSQTQNWKFDSAEEWMQSLASQNPPSMSALSLHLYPYHGDGSGFVQGPADETLELANRVSRQSGKPLWIGEFGNAPKATPAERLAQYRSMIGLLERHDVQFAAAWVYDYEPQPANNLATEENKPILELISQTNRSWSV